MMRRVVSAVMMSKQKGKPDSDMTYMYISVFSA